MEMTEISTISRCGKNLQNHFDECRFLYESLSAGYEGMLYKVFF